MRSIYLDNNASAPLRPEARAAIQSVFDSGVGNPSSIHRFGHRAKVVLENARRAVAGLLSARPEEIVFTAGGTEANNLALAGVGGLRGGGHLVACRSEHSSVLGPLADLERAGFRVTRLDPDRDGGLDPAVLLAALEPDTILVSLMHSNNEIGTLLPVEAVSAEFRRRGILLHCDAVQSAGKVPLDVGRLGVDLLSLSGHKFGGPPGAGCLWIREGVSLRPLLRGGGQEANRRAGTEAVALIAGFGAAAERAAEAGLAESRSLCAMRDGFEAELARRIPRVRFHGRGRDRLPNTSNFALPGTGGAEMVMALDLDGIAVSSGSACAAGTVRPSHVLEAMGCSAEEAGSSVRVSLGWDNREEDLGALLSALERRCAAESAPIAGGGPAGKGVR